jgi:branched-chain amino acid aminotransferase
MLSSISAYGHRMPADPTLEHFPAEPRFGDGAAFIDGEIVPIDEARIPIIDAGFLRSDATYDGLAVWNGRFFRPDEYLARFEHSCRKLRLEIPITREDLVAVLHALVRTTGLRHAYVWVICTRGTTEPGERDPRRMTNRFYAWVGPYRWLLTPADAARGMDAVVARGVQRIPPAALDPTIKSFHWGDLTAALYEAYDRGARYPILLDADDNVTEGAGYNVFAYVDGALITPADGVLDGITRRTVLELASRDGIRASTAPLPADVLFRATELFATSTAGGVSPITTLDGRPVGSGDIGPVTRRLTHLYWNAHDDPQYTMPVEYATAPA